MVTSSTRSRLLVAVSLAQLATGVAGLVVALRRHPYDVFWTRGQTDTIARDTSLRGTALSAPVSNLLAQAALTAVMARRPSGGAARALGGLGALQAAGYLGERLVRRRLRPSGLDRVESPLVVAGIGLAAAMAVLGARRNGPGWSVREGALYGGLPFLAVGHGPPLVVFSGLSAEHANPTGLARQFELQTLKPLARHFTVYAVNRKPGLPPARPSRTWPATMQRPPPASSRIRWPSGASPPEARSPSSSPSTTRSWSAGWCWPQPPAGCRHTAGRCSAGSPS